MKKVISLALCLMMLCSLFAVNVSAAIQVNERVPAHLNTLDGENISFGNKALSVPATASVTDALDGSNKVQRIAFNGTGARTEDAVILCYYTGLLSSWFSSNFEILMDVKPIKNSTGILTSIKDTTQTFHIFPSVFTEGNWSTVKIVVEKEDGFKLASSVYVKAQGADDSTYRQLTAGTDYMLDPRRISPSASYYGIDSRYMDASKVVTDDFMAAEYYLDNISVTRFDKGPNQNIIYTNDKEFVLDTSVNGTDGYPSIAYTDIDALAYRTTFTLTFDAIKTGGDRPVAVTYAPWSKANSQKAFTFNLWTGDKDVKYSYKVEYSDGKLVAVRRTPAGTNAWTTLVKDTDYSDGGVFGAWTYLKFSYVGTLFKDDAGNLAKYCGPNPAIDDVNTVWTFDNFQVTGAEAGVSATVNAAKTQATVGVVAPAGQEKVTPIVAVYDGNVLKAVGTAEITCEGDVVIDIANDVANPTIKLYVWDTLANGKPALSAAWDITNNVK